ncbi:hypothetical protein L6164_024012 [Bauhinia variegata]|uniref:Uncharacterized protein n=1 Tax=Bauhinia variegata TaxID=167791 RepID=A0ACB9LXL4_BAUVA|nr:hypothetical protein L6164_024012 [Bauhinia variegata]
MMAAAAKGFSGAPPEPFKKRILILISSLVSIAISRGHSSSHDSYSCDMGMLQLCTVMRWCICSRESRLKKLLTHILL